MGLRLSWYCIVFCWFTVDACSKEELVLIQLISNHGSKTPEQLYPNDPNPPNSWSEGMGAPTTLGKFQQYALGNFLRARYNGFITSNPLEIEVHSSSSEECSVSAQSQVAALYAPTPEFEIVWNLPWQPIHLHCHPEDEDKYFSNPYCPTAAQEYSRVLKSPESTQFAQKYKDLFDYWTIHSGWNIVDSDTARTLHTILKTEMEYNMTVPAWAKRHWDELRFVSEMSFYWRARTKLLRRLQAGPLIELTIGNMVQKATGTLPTKKIFLYSTYAENIAVFLNSLCAFNGREPPSSATVVLELYDHSSEYFVRMLYLNSTIPQRGPQELHLMKFGDCGEFCPLEYVVNYVKNLFPENWEEECKVI